MAKLDLGDDKSLQDIISAAIFQSLDDEKKGALIKSAIAYLLTPPQSVGYGRKMQSPLEEAYHHAVDSQVRRLAFEMLDKDEGIKAQLRSLLTEAMERAFTTHREATVERVANAIGDGLWKKDGDR